MKGRHSYADIAAKDVQAAAVMLRAGHYNHFVRLCQQYVEKVFKEVLLRLGEGAEYAHALHSHNVFRLCQKVSALTGIGFSRDEHLFFRSLTEYYFDTNYPGENYFEVSKEEAWEVYESLVSFIVGFEQALEACGLEKVRGVVLPEALEVIESIVDFRAGGFSGGCEGF